MEGVLDDVALRTDVHLADHAQSVHGRVERADPVRQRLGQHRDHPTREVDGVATLLGLDVERVAGAHVVADVRNRDVELESLALHFTVDRIVEIPRGLAVDGDERQIAEIHAPTDVALTDSRPDALGLGERLGGELVGHLVLAHRDLDLHSGVGRIPEDFCDVADRCDIARRLLHQSNDHDLPRLRTGAPFCRNQDIVGNAAVGCGNQRDPVLQHESPDEFLCASFEDLHHRTLGTPATIDADLPRHHAIAVHDFRHLAGREEHVLAFTIRNEEAVALRMPLHRAGNEFELLRDAQRALAVDHHLPFAAHRLEAPRERVALLLEDAEHVAKRCRRHRLSGIGEDLEDELARWQRVLVLLAFALQVRVGVTQRLAALGSLAAG